MGRLRQLGPRVIVCLVAFSVGVTSAYADEHAGDALPVGMTDTFDTDWTLVPMVTYSSLDNGRDDWREVSLDAYYRPTPTWLLGARLDDIDRGALSDRRLGVSLSHQASSRWEWHAEATFTSNPDFSARHAYGIGAIWQASAPLALLLDYRHLDFPEGPISQYMPGVTWAFSDSAALTGRYIYGRAFDARRFHAYSLRLDLGHAPQSRWQLAYTHGADPEKDLELDRVLLSNADYYSLYYRRPLSSDLDLLLGAEYERRTHLYSRTSASVGLAWRF